MKDDLEAINQILINHDPISLYFPDINNRDEYKAEAKEIYNIVNNCQTEEKLFNLICEIFERRFGKKIADKKENFLEIAHEIWRMRPR